MHLAYYEEMIGGIMMYSHQEECDCPIGENHWARQVKETTDA